MVLIKLNFYNITCLKGTIFCGRGVSLVATCNRYKEAEENGDNEKNSNSILN